MQVSDEGIRLISTIIFWAGKFITLITVSKSFALTTREHPAFRVFGKKIFPGTTGTL
ncbi:hypothetical protein HMPREF0322_04034 [Desulfitobacterium hafniense DP7]|uniref:Uncharacterized protein n=1 Tax=Desulfitobacterium hafniense DP7 TaxID=537010 RepID=G9XST3_DESHA|nr:hypothetical protein HMPREF0322_04034 [Desulfitobacterium hafniense DP7]